MATRTSRTKEAASDPTTRSQKKFRDVITAEESLQLHQTITIMSTLLNELTMSCHEITQLTRSSSYDITIDYIRTYEEMKQLLDIVKALVKSCDSKSQSASLSSAVETRTGEDCSSYCDSRDDCCDVDNTVTPLCSSRFHRELKYLTKTCHYMSRLTRGTSFETVDYVRGCEEIKQAKKVLKSIIRNLKNELGEDIWEASADAASSDEEIDCRDEYNYQGNACDHNGVRTPQPGYPTNRRRRSSMTRRKRRVQPSTRSTYSSFRQTPRDGAWEAAWHRDLGSWADDKIHRSLDVSDTAFRDDCDTTEERDGPPTARA